MNVDIANIRLLATEKGIGVESLIETLEAALLTAYRHTEGHAPHARVEVDRTSGSITVLGQEVDETGGGRAGVGRHPARLRPDRRRHRPSGVHPAVPGRRQ